VIENKFFKHHYSFFTQIEFLLHIMNLNIKKFNLNGSLRNINNKKKKSLATAEQNSRTDLNKKINIKESDKALINPKKK